MWYANARRMHVWVCVSERVSSMYFSPWLETLADNWKQLKNKGTKKTKQKSLIFKWKWIIFFFCNIQFKKNKNVNCCCCWLCVCGFFFIGEKDVAVIGESRRNWPWICWNFSFPPLLSLLLLLIRASQSLGRRTKTFKTQTKKHPEGCSTHPASRWRWWTEGRPSMGYPWNSSARWWSCEVGRLSNNCVTTAASRSCVKNSTRRRRKVKLIFIHCLFFVMLEKSLDETRIDEH